MGSGGPDDNDAQAGRLVVASTLKGQRGKSGGGIGPEETLVADTVRSHPRPGSNSDGLLVAAPLSHGSNPNSNMAGRGREDDVNLVAGPLGGGNDGIGRRSEDDPNLVAYALRKDPGGTGQGHNTNYVSEATSVRRLMPVECERLQALEDGWTDLGDTPDSPRYAALGDAVTASVAEWIGTRLRTVAQGAKPHAA